jgi:hypothetical protein
MSENFLRGKREEDSREEEMEKGREGDGRRRRSEKQSKSEFEKNPQFVSLLM